MRRFLLLMAAAAAFAAGCRPGVSKAVEDASADGRVVRVEPLSWWVGMKTPLQLMVQGPRISECKVSVRGGRGVKVVGVHKADSPDYLFVDVKVAGNAAPGTYDIVFETPGGSAFKYPYKIEKRADGSASRKGFDTSDMVYLIMPDRFANGDPSNDSVKEMAERASREADFGRHGGDLQGIIDHLDYIAGLGATAIWCTPLLADDQARASYHGYACSDYYHIDPRFGDNDLYRTFVDEAHKRGLKVIMDIVTNHCGTAHWWMENPPFKDWYHVFPEYTGTNVLFSAYMDPYASKRDIELQESGWFVPSMPDMNLDNPFVLKYFQQWAVWWTEFAGLDGLRVDTYPYNEPGPMSRWCEAVMDEYPSYNIVGECWDPDWSQLAYWQGGARNHDGFDSHLPAIMDFPLRDAVCTALAEDQPGWGQGMTRVYTSMAHDYAYADPSNMLIFLANHDHDRVMDLVGGDASRLKLGLALMATLRGIPQLFSGDEMGFRANGGRHNDGAKRVDFPGGWEGDPINLFTPEGRASCPEQADLYEYTSRLFNWRKGCGAIKHGNTRHFMTRDNTYAFFRYDSSDTVFVYINNSLEEKTVPWADYSEIAPSEVEASDITGGGKVRLAPGLKVSPKTALVTEF